MDPKTAKSQSIHSSNLAVRLEAIVTSNKKILGAPGPTTRNKKLLVARSY